MQMLYAQLFICYIREVVVPGLGEGEGGGRSFIWRPGIVMRHSKLSGCKGCFWSKQGYVTHKDLICPDHCREFDPRYIRHI